MNQFTFPDWQIWGWFATVGFVVIIASITALLLAKVWAAGVTQMVDMITEVIGDALQPKILGVGLFAVLVLSATFLIPSAVSHSATTLANLWPTATPAPPPHWDTYFPIATK